MFAINQTPETIVLTGQNRRAEIYLHGGLLNRYEILLQGAWFNAVKGYTSPQHCRETLTDGFHSAKLSPFACRVRHGVYRFGGRQYRLEGRFQTAGHAAHGLMYDADFKVINSGSGAQSAWVELAADYAQNDSGYPFGYRIKVRYLLDSDGLEIATRVENTGQTAMPLADGWHPYFTLGGRVDDWQMQINGMQRLVFDGDLVPDGGIVSDTRFQTASSLQGIELDNSFIIADYERAACVLENPLLRLTLKPDRSYPYLQIYIPDTRDAIALENLSGAPDCFNNGLGLQVLQPEEAKEFVTRYVLESKV